MNITGRLGALERRFAPHYAPQDIPVPLQTQQERDYLRALIADPQACTLTAELTAATCAYDYTRQQDAYNRLLARMSEVLGYDTQGQTSTT